MAKQKKQLDYLPLMQFAPAGYLLKRIKPLSASAITNAFKQITKVEGRKQIQRAVRRTVESDSGSAVVSLLLYSTTVEPSFISGSTLRNVSHSYVVVVELDELIVVLGSSTVAKELVGTAAQELEYGVVAKLFAEETSKYQKMDTSSMNISPNALRKKSYEADNLSGAMPVAGANRSIPRGMRVNSHSSVHTLTPTTGRISTSGGKMSIKGIINWARKVEAETKRPKNGSLFIDNFAKPCELKDLPEDVFPAGVRIDVGALRDGLDNGDIEAMSILGVEGLKAMSGIRVSRLLNGLEGVFDVSWLNDQWCIHRENKKPVGHLKINKNSITLSLNALEKIRVKLADGETVGLARYLNTHYSFVVTFSLPQYVYDARNLFKDDGFLGRLDGLLATFVGLAVLDNVTSEKGDVDNNATSFSVNSIFREVEAMRCQECDVVICDDLGDEWADYLCVTNKPTSASFEMIACKHDEVGLSASNLQIVFGQALKNLGRLHPVKADLDRKVVSWSAKYSGSQINPIRKGVSAQAAADSILSVLAIPHTLRRVTVVASSLSRQQLSEAFATLKVGKGRPQLIQLVWLVSSFIGQCLDIGATPQILCRS